MSTNTIVWWFRLPPSAVIAHVHSHQEDAIMKLKCFKLIVFAIPWLARESITSSSLRRLADAVSVVKNVWFLIVFDRQTAELIRHASGAAPRGARPGRRLQLIVYMHMASANQTTGSKSLPQQNYGSAVARAIEWLGDRYLLAKPINAKADFNGFRRHTAAARPGRGCIPPES